MAELGARDAHAAEYLGRGQGPAQAAEVGAQPPPVIGRRVERPAARARAGQVGVVVAGAGRKDEAGFRVLGHEVEHLRRRRDITRGSFPLEGVARRLADIVERGLGRVGEAAGAGLGVVGDPDHALGQRRGAAQNGRLLDDQDVEPEGGRGHGGGQPSGARSDDQHVRFPVFHCGDRHWLVPASPPAVLIASTGGARKLRILASSREGQTRLS